MRIDSGYFYVNGDYYLRCKNARTFPLAYPFPEDSLYGKVDQFRIIDMDNGNVIEATRFSPSSALFPLALVDTNAIHLNISYRQALKGGKAEYILTTTAAWGKGLEKASYQLIIPESMEITVFSIPPDRQADLSGKRIYYWERVNYFPERNLRFLFRQD